MDYRPLWTGLGIVAGYLAAVLGLSFYFRRRIGARLWRKAHRATIVVYALGVVHTLGAGTDADGPWLRAYLLATGAPIAFLFLLARPARRTRPPPRARPGGRHERRHRRRRPGGPALRRDAAARGYDGPIRMVCGEGRLPYDRPPLSKERARRPMRRGRAALRPAAWYAENEVELLLGDRGASRSTRRAQVPTRDGSSCRYDSC